MPVLTIEGLTKRFEEVTANDHIALRVRAGEVVGLVGHNGAGKTTLVSQVVGLLRPDVGTIEIAGTDAVLHPARARRSVALQAQGQASIDGLTPRMAIELAGRLRGLPKRHAREQAERLAHVLDIGPWLDRRALSDDRGISGGVRRLVGFAMAVAAPTPLIILDEPTNDVDVSRRQRLWRYVRQLADDGAGVLLITHNVSEAERVIDELVVLDHGRVIAAGTPRALRGAGDRDVCLELQLGPDGRDPSRGDGRAPMPVLRQVRSGRRARLTVAAADAASAVHWATHLRATARIDSYSLAPATLEDSYLALTAPGATARREADTERAGHD